MQNIKIMRNIRNLIVGHPDLPIYFFVDSEVVADDSYCSWIGEAYDVSIEKIWEGDTQIWTYSKVIADVDDFLYEEAPEELMRMRDELPEDEYIEKEDAWIECILCSVGTTSL